MATIALSKGQALDVSPVASGEKLSIQITNNTDPPDLIALLLSGAMKVSRDSDVVFFNSPVHPSGAAEQYSRPLQRIDLQLGRLPDDVSSILIVCANGPLDADAPSSTTLEVRKGNVHVAGADLPCDAREKSAVVFRISRVQGQWLLRSELERHRSTLADLLTLYGVSVEGHEPQGKQLPDEIVGAMDSLIGREDAPSEFGDLENVGASRIIPASVRNSEPVKIVNQSVAIGSLGVAIVGLLFGTGTLTAVNAAFAQSTGAPTSIGSYITFSEAFWASLSWSIAAAVGVWMLLSGNMKSYGQVGGWVLLTAIVNGAIISAGLTNAPPTEELNAAVAEYSNPIAKALMIIGKFLEFYGPLAFLGGMAVGAAAGWAAHRLQGHYSVGTP